MVKVPQDAVLDYSNLLSVISDIRMKSGLGAKPMLSELADAIGGLRAQVERLERENETYRTAFDGIEPAAQEGREAMALPERDTSVPAENQGLFRKFDVRRVDDSDRPGGKHFGCRYFVLDVDHDPHALAALSAYAAACEATHPELARDLREKCGAPPQPAAQVVVKELEWTQKAPPALDHEPFVYWAAGLGGHYRADRDGFLWMAHDAFVWEQYPSQKAAKAAAQADYERRILSALASPTDADAAVSGGVTAIAAERRRQIDKEGWTRERDNAYLNGELARAGGIYAVIAGADATDFRNARDGYSLNDYLQSLVEHYWPWDKSWLKVTTRRRALEKAGACIAAEIDRLDRLTAAKAGEDGR